MWIEANRLQPMQTRSMSKLVKKGCTTYSIGHYITASSYSSPQLPDEIKETMKLIIPNFVTHRRSTCGEKKPSSQCPIETYATVYYSLFRQGTPPLRHRINHARSISYLSIPLSRAPNQTERTSQSRTNSWNQNSRAHQPRRPNQQQAGKVLLACHRQPQ